MNSQKSCAVDGEHGNDAAEAAQSGAEQKSDLCGQGAASAAKQESS